MIRHVCGYEEGLIFLFGCGCSQDNRSERWVSSAHEAIRHRLELLRRGQSRLDVTSARNSYFG
jgi:uncharacterized protein YaeQ